MSLREELALQMLVIEAHWSPSPINELLYGAADARDVDWTGVHIPEKTLRLADECIRQMEWARTLRGEQWRGDGRDGTRHLVELDDEPLSLAPEDWKP